MASSLCLQSLYLELEHYYDVSRSLALSAESSQISSCDIFVRVACLGNHGAAILPADWGINVGQLQVDILMSVYIEPVPPTPCLVRPALMLHPDMDGLG